MVTGARQVGKTTLIEQFGADHYEHVAEVNFIEMPQAVETVSKAKDTEDLILRLSVLSGAEITPGKTLLFLDEIQACEGHAYVFHDGNVETVGRAEYLPIYMLGCLSVM